MRWNKANGYLFGKSIIFILTVLLVTICVFGTFSTEAATQTNQRDAGFGNTKIAYTAQNGLYIVNMKTARTDLIVKSSDIQTPVFSRDGKAVAYMLGQDLYAYSFENGKSKKLLSNATSFCQGQTGQFYASSQKTGIVTVEYNSAKAKTIVASAKDTYFNNLSLSPDLKLLAYDTVVSGVENQDRGGVWILDLNKNNPELIVQAEKMSENSMGLRPAAGKWTPDSSRLFIWMMSNSGSLSADGVGTALYDIKDSKLINLDTGALAYNENVTFANADKFALISGGSRSMFENKTISIFDLKTGIKPQNAAPMNKVTTTPYYSSDGSRLLFAASPAAAAGDEYKKQIATIFKRQIYMLMNNKYYQLTNSTAYRSEAPVFLKNNNYIVFARQNSKTEQSIWIMDSDGKNQIKLASWKYNDPEDNRATDFYGRINWSNMFSIYDDTRPQNTTKIPVVSIN
ncbi:MAG: hypothetical protein Q8920_15330 [Bacillota bacterium]|nr:hypothetical protein [Bacillota bacterium]